MIGKPNSSKDRTRANVCKDIIPMALIWSTTILLLNSSYDFSSKSLSGVTIIHCLPIHHAKNTTIRSDCAREEPPCRISGLASLPSNISLVLFFCPRIKFRSKYHWNANLQCHVIQVRCINSFGKKGRPSKALGILGITAGIKLVTNLGRG